MNVVYVANEAYARHLAVSLCSLLDRNRKERELSVMVVSTGIGEESRKKLREIAGRYGRTLLFSELSKEQLLQAFGGVLDTGRFDVSTMGRLVLDELLPEHWDRVLYLDSDTVVLRPLGKLWRVPDRAKSRGINQKEEWERDKKVNREDYDLPVLYAVEEPTIYPQVKAYLGLSRGEPYFNAGVLLIDLAAFRQEDLFRKVREAYGRIAEQSLFNDQDALNGCPELRGRIGSISPVWNFFTNYRYFRYRTLGGMSPSYKRSVKEAEYRMAKRRPAVVHYAGAERPWVAGAMNYYGRAYEAYLEKTPFRGSEKEKGRRLSMFLYHGMEIMTVLSPSLRNAVSQRYVKNEIRKRAERFRSGA